jgi:pimeloyl-ACP methyl ester carboxylesterase
MPGLIQRCRFCGENFFPHFANLGYYPLVAFIDCRGSGEHDETTTEITIEERCDDLQCLLDQLPDIMGNDAPLPILASHSFGGMIAMKYLEGLKQKPSEAFSKCDHFPQPAMWN